MAEETKQLIIALTALVLVVLGVTFAIVYNQNETRKHEASCKWLENTEPVCTMPANLKLVSPQEKVVVTK